MEIDTKALEEEVKLLEDKSSETTPNNTNDTNNTNQTSIDNADLKQYVSFFHKIIYTDMLKLDISSELMDELNSSGAKILEKYMPKTEILGKFSAEIAYISVLGYVLMQNKQKPQNQEVQFLPTENKENVGSEQSNS